MGAVKYNPLEDKHFAKPYVDKRESRECAGNLKYLYIHGGFEGTDTRFSLFFPEREKYEGRFYQFMSPFQGSEDSSEGEDNMTFALNHGAYFLETNMGGTEAADSTMLYKASAACATYSREVAKEVYAYEHRPYGYIYGGSGGSYKTMGCIENTAGVWDGAVPFVIGNPMAIPVTGIVAAYAMLRLDKKIEYIQDAVEPGSSHSIYEGLSEEEQRIFDEAKKMGFPPYAWLAVAVEGKKDFGSLPVLIPGMKSIDPEYFTDFWTKPGYNGTNPDSYEVKHRLQFETTIIDKADIKTHEGAATNDEGTGVDDAWKRLTGNNDISLWIKLADVPEPGNSTDGANVRFITGKAAGKELAIRSLKGDILELEFGLLLEEAQVVLKSLEKGDKIIIDNSDFLAIQTYHHHQVPGKEWQPEFTVFDQYKDKSGNPLYPQRPMLAGPLFAANGGCVQNGNIEGKVIIASSLADNGACPWMADWYREKIKLAIGEEKAAENVRVYFTEHALHGDDPKMDSTKFVSYVGGLYQLLVDISKWVEQGQEPPKDTVYTVEDGQVSVPAEAKERKGIQPVVKLFASTAENSTDGSTYKDMMENKNIAYEVLHVQPEEAFTLYGEITLPQGAGQITEAVWYPAGTTDNWEKAELTVSGDGLSAKCFLNSKIDEPGTYFPTLKAYSNRIPGDRYTNVINLARIRVIVG